MEIFDAIVIGGGAAGLMCAIEAGKRKRSVVVLEHGDRLGRKILISGGGRCNFTNLHATAANFLTSGSPHFCKSALAGYSSQDFIQLVEKHGIAYHEKKLGQLFCDRSSKEIVAMLETECDVARVQRRVHCRVTAVRKTDVFQVETTLGMFSAPALVIATGGLSFPKLGATDFGYKIANQFGIEVTKTKPGLVPLTLADQIAFAELSGLSLDVEAAVREKRFRENILFTHRGVSGPAILQVSSFREKDEPVTINLLPDLDPHNALKQRRSERKELATVLSQWLPQRFAHRWCEAYAPSRPMNQISDREIRGVADKLQAWAIQPDGDEGYPKAEVTVGGVDTNELSSKTLEARRVPGLYFIGEVVDITGWLGGYNFQWAWASGVAAGKAIGAPLLHSAKG